MNDIIFFIINIAVLLFSVSVHESAHGWMAEKFGDPTARLQGRITLNPIKHIDLFGSIIVPVALALLKAPVFGWAKPVRVDPYQLRNRRKAWMYVAAAGPISNLILASISAIVFVFLRRLHIAVPELLLQVLFLLVIINVILAIFNLMPIPPLDGSKILESTLRGEALRTFEKIQPYGMIIFILIIYTGIFDKISTPIMNLVVRILFTF
jgi:Zn-dependent protease